MSDKLSELKKQIKQRIFDAKLQGYSVKELEEENGEEITEETDFVALDFQYDETEQSEIETLEEVLKMIEKLEKK